MFVRVVGRKLFGNISECMFPTDSQVNAIGIYVNGEIQIVYGIVFFFRYFEFKMFVYVIHMVYDCLFVCFVLVKNDQNVVYVSFVRMPECVLYLGIQVSDGIF